jgi:hypothetical protein
MVARLKVGAACDDAGQRCAPRCPTRLRHRIRQAWIRVAASADMSDASLRDCPWLLCLVPVMPGMCRSCLCSRRGQPSWSGGFAVGWRVGGDDGDQRRYSVCQMWDQDRGWKKRVRRGCVCLSLKGGPKTEENRLVAQSTKKVEAAGCSETRQGRLSNKPAL